MDHVAYLCASPASSPERIFSLTGFRSVVFATYSRSSFFLTPQRHFSCRSVPYARTQTNPNQHQGGAHGGCMRLHTDLRKSPFGKTMFGRAALATAALSGFALFAGVPSAKADNCQRRIQHAEHELGEAIEDHGYYSRQADRWRHERHEAYEACEERGAYRNQNGYYRDRNGYYRDERGNYLYFRYDDNRDRHNHDYDRDRRRSRDWDEDRD